MDLKKYRDIFPVTKSEVYLNHAAVSPFSSNVIKAINEFLEMRSKNKVDEYPLVIEKKKDLKKNIGNLINGNPKNVAIIGNTSEGLNWLVNSLSWKPSDRIVLTDYEFPSNVYPFLNLKRFGVEVDFVNNRDGKIYVEDIESKITSRTRIVSISFVEFLNGFRNNLNEIGKICKSKNILFSVDGIQGVGALPIDVKSCGIDFISNGGHKWIMGPQGCGFMYIAPELHEKLVPAFAGWLSVKDSWNFLDYKLDFIDDAGRYEIGTSNALGIIGCKASTDLLVEIGPESIKEHLFLLGDYLIDSFEDIDLIYNGSLALEERSGIYSFYYKDSEILKDLHQHLLKNRIHVSFRNGALRVSPHFYNEKGDIEHLITTCKSYLKKN
jgi:cysteine desulfurase / selenocysteine lyase